MRLLFDINKPIIKTYIHSQGQILAQHDGKYDANRYFYLHDRLGSVRQIMDNDANVVNLYTYEPFDKWFIGDELEETKINNFCFTGQYYEREQRRNSRQLSGFD